MRGARSLWMVNVTGAVLACALGGVGVWSAGRHFGRSRPLSADVSELRVAVADRTRDLASLERELGRQQALLEERKQTLAAAGAPPAQTPIEEDLRTITALARQERLRLLEVAPLEPVSYPGVRELRYRIRARGRYADLAAMLRRFETCRFWADVTSLQMQAARDAPGSDARADPAASPAEPTDREMTLTVSFYSTAEPVAQVEPQAVSP